jgi:pimeloyl-ACP methyl ester carboxylesterase
MPPNSLTELNADDGSLRTSAKVPDYGRGDAWMPAPTTTGTTTIDGVSWAWQASGEGPCVFFFHGTLGGRAVWDSAVGELAERYRCVAVDWPGHGRSGFNPAGWTVEYLVRAVPLLLADMGVQRAVLVGLSQGGAISLRVALSRPDLVAGLVTVGAGPDGPAPDVAAGLAQLGGELAVADEPGRRARLAGLQDSYHAPGWARREPEAAERELAAMSSLVPRAYPLLARIPGQYGTVQDELGGIRCPALVVWGAHDPRAFWGPRMAQLIPAARLAVIGNAGHHVPLDAPKEFNRVLADFLDHLALPHGTDMER